MIKKWIMNFIIGRIVNKPEVKTMLTNAKTYLSGKKTYLVAFAAIVAVLVSWASGSVSDAEAIKAVVEAVLACTIRAGVAKV